MQQSERSFLFPCCLPHKPTVSLQITRSCVTRPLLFFPSTYWTTPFFFLLSHWTGGLGNELILVKNSWAREWLKIERYIRPAVQPRCSLVFPGCQPKGQGRRGREGETDRRKKERQTGGEGATQQKKESSIGTLPFSSFLYKCCARDSASYVLHATSFGWSRQ